MGATLLMGCLLGVAGILIILFYLLKNDNKFANGALQILLVGFLLFMVVMLGKTAVINNDNCSWLVTDSTTSGSTSTYGYTYTCSTNTDNTASLLYQLTLWIMRLIVAYIIIGFAFEIISYYTGLKEKRAKGEEDEES